MGQAIVAAHSSSVKGRKVGYSLFDFSGTEEDREKDSVRLALQRFTPLLRMLFDKYTAKPDFVRRQPHKNPTVSEKVITLAELVKLYRDHNLDHTMLSKNEFQMLVALINDKLMKPYDDDALNFPGFVQFFW